MPDKPDFEWEFEGPEFEFPEGGILIPERITEGFSRLTEGFRSKLGIDVLSDILKPRSSDPSFLIYVENPLRDFGGIQLPRWRAELDLEKLSQESWVSMLRKMLLFIIVCMFISSFITILRKG